MTDFLPFMCGMFAMVAVVAFTAAIHPNERKQMARTAVAIFANWLCGLVYVNVTGNLTPWHFNIFIDALAAFAVMFHPAGRVQGFIGVFYFLQIALHVGFGIRALTDMSADPICYYDAITYVAWAQLAAMGVWSAGVWMGDLVHHRRHRSHADDRGASAAHSRKAK